MEKYTTLEIVRKTPNSSVFYLNLNRPSVRNALSPAFWTEFLDALSSLDQNPDVGVIVLAGNGSHFCAGIDLKSLKLLTQDVRSSDRGRTGERLRREIKALQDAITSVERCRKPVIAAVQGACIGAGVDIITACDIRYCTEDAFFSVKEVDLAMAADVGTLQRLPAIVGFGNAMELALTARRFSGTEAKELGLVSMVFASKAAMDEGVGAVAEGIAAKSPLGVVGTKAVLLRSRDMTVSQGLDYVATWNSAVLLSDDLTEVMSVQSQKRKPRFAKL